MVKWAEENGKRKSPLARAADGDTVPSFPALNVFFPTKHLLFLLFFKQHVFRSGLVTSCQSGFFQYIEIHEVVLFKKEKMNESAENEKGFSVVSDII